jgi:hypothetical protein
MSGRRLAVAAWLPAALMASAALKAQTQSPLRFTEVARSGNEHPIAGQGPAAVDVNSDVRIDIDRAALRQAMGGATLPQELVSGASSLTKVLQGANVDLAGERAAETEFAANPADPIRRELAIRMRASVALRAAAIVSAAPQGSGLRAALNSALERGGPAAQRYAAVFAAATDYAAALERQADSAASAEGVKVRMGAWLMTDRGSRELHLPGFDTVATSPASVVPSFQIFLTDDQIAQFRALHAEAERLKLQADATPFANVTELRSRLQLVASTGVMCLSTLPDQLKALGDGNAAAQGLISANQNLVRQLESMNSRYAAGVPLGPDFLLTAPIDVTTTFEAVKSWVAAVAAVLHQPLPPAGAAVKDALDTCSRDVQNRLTLQLGPLASAFTGERARRLAQQSLEFSERVFSLDLASVPTQTQLSLVMIGPREPGDQLAFRMSAVNGSGQERLVAARTFAVERAEPFIHLTVAMIWAYREPPIDEKGMPRGNRWHPAPGYSILAKRFFPGETGFARRHPLYAEVLNPGIGLNLSAPDFDLNDNPEFAAGIVGSVFRDYIQGGWSFNFQKNRPFFFLGVRLPLPSATLPATENTSPTGG